MMIPFGLDGGLHVTLMTTSPINSITVTSDGGPGADMIIIMRIKVDVKKKRTSFHCMIVVRYSKYVQFMNAN